MCAPHAMRHGVAGFTPSSIASSCYRLGLLQGHAEEPETFLAELAQGQAELDAKAMAWRSEAADDHSRVLAQCFAVADHGPGAAALTAEKEDEIWQQAIVSVICVKCVPQLSALALRLAGRCGACGRVGPCVRCAGGGVGGLARRGGGGGLCFSCAYGSAFG